MLSVAVCLFLSLSRTEAQDFDYSKQIDRAVRLMDAGLLTESEELLRSVLAAESRNYAATYELGYLRYLQEDYRACEKIVSGILDWPEVQDVAYQLLGNAYDRMGKHKKAVETYEKGLVRFPDSGKLHYEKGIVAFNGKVYLTALACFEEGIAAEPAYPSNYYGASTLFLVSDQPIWGIFYGEMFMNLERGTDRTAMMSSYLYKSYQDHIKLEFRSGERNMELGFCNVAITDFFAPLPYAAICEVALGGAFPEDARAVDLNAIIRMRIEFLNRMSIDAGTDEKLNEALNSILVGFGTPNALLDYQRRVSEAGHLEAYNHWILMYGDPEQSDAWQSTHQDEWNGFLEWFVKNPICVDKEHYFHRNLFE